ncbi:hypothetical protein MHH74_29660 [Bacillus sp. FSL M7-0996]|uniref:hypothetical protein n=1 Tax=Bacillus sp. FSL M7-0996 TaxID=2921538 RepID=UPI0030F93567
MEKQDVVHTAMKDWKSALQLEQEHRLEDLKVLREKLEVSNAKIHCFTVLLNELNDGEYKKLQELNSMCMKENKNNEEIIEEIQKIEEKIWIHENLNQKLIPIIESNLR